MDNIEKLRGLVEFYVEHYDTHLPPSTLQGLTPYEMYFGTGGAIPDELASASRKAMKARVEANREVRL